MRVRLATPGDAEAIRAIYNAEISGDVNTFDLVPRTADEQRDWMARHQGARPAVVAVAGAGGPDGSAEAPAHAPAHAPSHAPPQAPAGSLRGPIAAAYVPAGTVIGFGSLSPFRNRPAYSTTVEDSVYVAADQRGRGAGRALLENLLRMGAEHGFHSMIARIVSGNEPSIALHRACGFEVVGVEREVGRKHGRWLDVVELQHLL